MKRLVILAMLAALVVAAVAGAASASYGVAIRATIVNPDRSITITWALENANVVNASVAVDGIPVRSGSDRSTGFRTAPLSAGWHTIAIEVREFFETYSPQGSGCMVTGGHYMCFRTWRSSTSVSVRDATEPRCTVPRVLGLQLTVAKARIRAAGCSLGSLKHVESRRPAGTVLRQRRHEAAISLVISRGPPATAQS